MSYFLGGGLFSSNYSSNNSFGFSYDMLSDYASIRNGSYGKLLKKYYSEMSNDSKESSSSSSSSNKYNANNGTSTDSTLTAVKNDVESLKDAANKLSAKGEDSLFTEKEITTTDENGVESTTTGYDVDAIVKAVKSFATEYNDLITSAPKASSLSVQQKALSIVQNTASNSKALEKIGITIGSDGKLSVDEDKLKEANMENVKYMFNGTGSFGQQTASRASMVASEVSRAEREASMYNNNGQYQYNNFSSGNFFNSFS